MHYRKLVVLGVAWVSFAGPASAAGPVVKFKANIVQKACTISFSGDNVVGGKFTIPDVTDTASSGDIVHTVQGATTPVTLTLAGCGLASAVTRPTIKLSGGSIPYGVTGGGGKEYLFRKGASATDVVGGTSVGYYIVVGRKAAPNFNGSDLWKTPDTIFTGVAGDNGNAKTVVVYPGVYLERGQANAGTARAGTLKASLEFTFSYS